MKNHLTSKAIAVLAGLASWYATTARAVTLYTNTIASQNFDTNTVGQLPPEWTGLPVVNANAFVTNSVSLSSPNSLEATYTGTTFFNPWRSFPGINLFQYDQGLSYSVSLNVANITDNNSEGFRIGVHSGSSRLDVGSPRILREGAIWNLYAFQNGQNAFVGGNLSFNQWYNFRVDISPSSPTAGTAYWYLNGALINTEPYSGKSVATQTTNVHYFEVFDIPSSGATMYLDNLVIQAIVPEPTSMALLAAGGFLFLIRRLRIRS